MKRLLLIALTSLSIHAIAQTNTFPTSGNVGIGTTTPTSRLEIFNTAQEGQLILSTNDSPSADQSRIDLDYKIANTNQTIGRISSAYLNSANGGSGALRLYTSNDGVLGEKMKIDNNGNVGIGTGNPQYKLDVNGNTRINGSIFTNEIHFVANDMGATVDNSDPYTLRKIHDASNVSHLDLNLNDDGDESFRIYGNSCAGFGCGTYSGNLYHSFDASGNVFHAGNVGIGTQHPAYKLDVLGSIRAKEVLVNLDGGADFVFEKDYKLLPIEHVANYVQKNKHLPNIPSANEMVKNGVSMGDLQVKLLQKVEELTLYAIQQNKKIETLMKRIDELEAK